MSHEQPPVFQLSGPPERLDRLSLAHVARTALAVLALSAPIGLIEASGASALTANQQPTTTSTATAHNAPTATTRPNANAQAPYCDVITPPGNLKECDPATTTTPPTTFAIKHAPSTSSSTGSSTSSPTTVVPLTITSLAKSENIPIINSSTSTTAASITSPPSTANPNAINVTPNQDIHSNGNTLPIEVATLVGVGVVTGGAVRKFRRPRRRP